MTLPIEGDGLADWPRAYVSLRNATAFGLYGCGMLENEPESSFLIVIDSSSDCAQVRLPGAIAARLRSKGPTIFTPSN